MSKRNLQMRKRISKMVQKTILIKINAIQKRAHKKLKIVSDPIKTISKL